jgi:cytochrome c-type biogenesis protein CcmH/NrfG
MSADTVHFELSESEINRLGYFFLSRGVVSRAVDVFSLNVRAFPGSANVYDSLGEAQLARGDTALAITSYRRSLELDPGNTNASNILRRIVRRP